ncbi:hypothetical protein BDV98DRAFT_576553 [Pterulicium gracile]|uniref:Uncharacterized protein n=1 Tax=Pterulicium gracile TaxID=1884261 RepID=A0A5C3Q724_9AGAR|nr:hypothetical protein BDV98DRAFT_576553 [Pterula gracilis]
MTCGRARPVSNETPWCPDPTPWFAGSVQSAPLDPICRRLLRWLRSRRHEFVKPVRALLERPMDESFSEQILPLV